MAFFAAFVLACLVGSIAFALWRKSARRSVEKARRVRHRERARNWWVLHSFLPNRRKRLSYQPQADTDDG